MAVGKHAGMHTYIGIQPLLVCPPELAPLKCHPNQDLKVPTPGPNFLPKAQTWGLDPCPAGAQSMARRAALSRPQSSAGVL